MYSEKQARSLQTSMINNHDPEKISAQQRELIALKPRVLYRNFKKTAYH
jgi:hypothetical protein